VIRHLAGGGPERRDVLTECSLPSALPGSLTMSMGYMNCPDCRASLISRGICPACGEEALAWDCGTVKLAEVPDGRLRLNEVETQFWLGCETCSETLIHGVSPDEVVKHLTEAGWRPPR
jgi:hypothetical protein